MDYKIIWSSSYGLMESLDSDESFGISVTHFNDETTLISSVQDGRDIDKEFKTVSEAHDWFLEFTAGYYVEHECDFDFRDLDELI